MFLRSLSLLADRVPGFDAYPFSIPAVRHLQRLDFHPKVTFFIGENGSGKSTLLEAIAVLAGFNAEGGSKNFHFATTSHASVLPDHLRLSRGSKRERNGFFLRAESFFNVATTIDQLGIKLDSYGGTSLHELSHGESFLALANHRFGNHGLYLLDEPEAALSPMRQLSLLQILHRLVQSEGSQVLIATHSPILMAYPDAQIFSFDESGISKIAYDETQHVQLTRDFLASPPRFLKHLLADDV